MNDQATNEIGMPRPAVFLDRDGTITEHVGYITNSSQIQLVAGAADFVRKLRDFGFACILVTNQSAIGRGMLMLDQLEEIHEELKRQLRSSGTELDGIYFAPHKPCQMDETVIECPDRKPGHGMLVQAAAELNLDLPNSWMIGDRISDVLAGLNAGCRSIRVRTGFTYQDSLPLCEDNYETVDTLQDALRCVLHESLTGRS